MVQAEQDEMEQTPTISVNDEWCKRCGICVAFCPVDVFDETEEGLPVAARPEDCIECDLCEYRCPDFAITVRGENDG